MASTREQQLIRATRFAMNLPVRYRVQGDTAWSYGMSVNVSTSGLLFRADRDVNPQASMQIQVVLPGDEQGAAAVAGRGSVTRVSSHGRGADHLIAAQLDAADLVRTSRSTH